MPNSIKKLSKEISMLIAAGEVIERPVSVIKELVENSIDADSRIIIIEIEKGGFDSISVSDNGGGINSAEIKLAFERHATSKIENKEDIHEVKSLGFRGEALSAINSVSEVECISREKNSKDSTKISFSFATTFAGTSLAATTNGLDAAICIAISRAISVLPPSSSTITAIRPAWL